MLTVPPCMGPAGDRFGTGDLDTFFGKEFSLSFLFAESGVKSDDVEPSGLVCGVDNVDLAPRSTGDGNPSASASLASENVEEETGLSST